MLFIRWFPHLQTSVCVISTKDRRRIVSRWLFKKTKSITANHARITVISWYKDRQGNPRAGQSLN